MMWVSAAAAVALHGGGMWLGAGDSDARIEAGAGAAEARIGTSFADMAAGTVQPVSEAEITSDRPADRAATTPAPAASERPRTPDTAPASSTPPAVAPRAEPATTAASETARTAVTHTTRESGETPPVTGLALSPAPRPIAAGELVVTSPGTIEETEAAPAPAPRPAQEPLSLAALIPLPGEAKPPLRGERTRPPAISPVTPETVVTAAPDTGDGLGVSHRPRTRPQSVEEVAREHQARAAALRPPEPAPRMTTAARTGNNSERDATRGSTTGRDTATAARSGRETGRPSEESGDAAASNYPGQVMARLARVPRPRLGSRGAAVVRFSINASGGLSGVGLARGSGSPQLDSAAIAVVRGAAPFPPPPRGAQRDFSIRIESR